MSGPDPGRASESATADARRDRRGTYYAVLGLVVLLIGTYAAAVALSGDDLPAGTEVAGVELGGLSTAEAEERLRTELVPRAREPIVLAARGHTFRIHPRDVGLALDVEATVERAQGGSRIDPRRLWSDLTATVGPVSPVVDVDQAALIATVHRVADRVERKAVEPWISFVAAASGAAPAGRRPRCRHLTGDRHDPRRLAGRDGDWSTCPRAGADRGGQGRPRPGRTPSSPARRWTGRCGCVPADAPSWWSRGSTHPALRYRVVDGALAPVVDARQLARARPGAGRRRSPPPAGRGRRAAPAVTRRSWPRGRGSRSCPPTSPRR